MQPMIFSDTETAISSDVRAIAEEIKLYAANLYETRQFLCSEAVLVALNRGLGGGLTEEQAVSMAAPFGYAMGNSGCICGALSGAVMGAGLIMGNSNPYSRRKEMRESALMLHNAFKETNGATCCRILSKKVKHDKKAHFRQCADITANATEMAALLVLQRHPELLSNPSLQGITLKKKTLIGGLLTSFFRNFHK
ncbi:C-GCAxxG-C-C family protein [Desulfamplus magnetovallimortis]|nr:C-GCAxxG-C-C family protein [Desulfamplus magnetovallimortis]